MMNIKLPVSVCLVVLFSAVFAQEDNLVVNPSFETLEGKVKRGGSLDAAEGWYSPTENGADLFSKESKSEEYMAGDNLYGREKPMEEGSNYAGAVFYSYKSKDPRMYLTAELSNSLSKGEKYCVKYHVSLSDLSKYAVNNISAYLSKKKIEMGDEDKLLFDAQVMHPKNKIFKEQYTWEAMCAPYTAKGGEKYITIGNFASDTDTKFEKIKRPPGFRAPQIYSAYYFIDNVSIIPIGEDSECDCEEKKSGQEMKVVYSKQVIGEEEELTDEQQVENSTIYFGDLKKEMTPSAEAHLKKLAIILINNPAYKLTVEGHADKTEVEKAKTSIKNTYDELSKKRAEAVVDFLAGKGVARTRLQAVAKDDAEPIDQGDSELSRAKNRRVEFKLTGK